MEIINYKDFNKCNLEKIDYNFIPKNKFFIDKERNIIYKIFKDISLEECSKKEQKLLLFSELNKNYLPNIREIIKDEGIMVGYSQDYIYGSTLHRLMKKREMLENIKAIIKMSENMEDLHNSEGNPIIGDMHFENVIIDENNTPIFIDIDSYGIDNIESENIPLFLWKYLNHYNMDITKNQNTDRLSLILNLINRTVGRDINHLAEFAYQDYTYTYPFLKNLQPVFIELKRAKSNIPEVPYLHKVLKNYENS